MDSMERASGFCVYNDSSVAIKYLQEKYGARVLYIDTDAHHGIWCLMELLIMIRQSVHCPSMKLGAICFPEPEYITERGNGAGYGTSFNFPIDAFTEDDSFLSIYKTAIKEVTEFFKPDVILTQNGEDAHYFDPLTHLYGTMDIYKEIPRVAREIAEQYCEGRWIAVGGGGYDIWRVVPRAWAHIWLAMKNIPAPTGPLPEDWLSTWQEKFRYTYSDLGGSCTTL